jgi:response regulator NasT
VIEAFVFDWITGLNGCVPVVIFSNDARTEKIQAAIRAGVASYVVDGFRLDRMIPILETAISRHHEFQLIKQELNLAKSDLADRKLIDRAKGLVMAQRGCSESDAYHLLRKMAMNQKKRLADVAHDILIVGEVFKS